MTRKTTTLQAPFALLSSTLGTVLVSVTAVWLATSAYAPAARPDAAAPPSVLLARFIVPIPIPPVAHPPGRRRDLLVLLCALVV
jgi:hypothetical protein